MPRCPPRLRTMTHGQAQSLREALRGPAAWPIPSSLDVPDDVGIQSDPGRQLLLGEPQPEPGGSDLPREAVPFRNEPGSKGGFDHRPAPGPGLALPPFPRRDRLRAAARPLGKWSLRQ